MLAKKKAERRHAIAVIASAERQRKVRRMRPDAKDEKDDEKEKMGKVVGKRHRTSEEEDHTVDPMAVSAENPADVLRAIGDHVNTRLQKLEFDDDLDADLFDEQQRQLREEAAIAAGTKSRVLSTAISGFFRQQEEQNKSVKMLRVGHNSNALTAVCGLGSELVVFGDKSGSVYMAELRGSPSPPLSSNSSQKTLLRPCLPQRYFP
ncbi:hypothetical protein C3747_296g3 [Trypanosoma cruzi]|uniref:Uncharacterized protein n=1 Tax=Trypanosoma cruzi TaxID=5693 RepID=A0A2V2VCQ7_TRYCR|nr:hypothetical protein C3747_296g3 [Trypanosoma cruzi]